MSGLSRNSGVLKSEGETAARRYLDTLELSGPEWAILLEFSSKHSSHIAAQAFLDYLDKPLTLSDARAILGGQPSERDRMHAHGMGISL